MITVDEFCWPGISVSGDMRFDPCESIRVGLLLCVVIGSTLATSQPRQNDLSVKMLRKELAEAKMNLENDIVKSAKGESGVSKKRPSRGQSVASQEAGRRPRERNEEPALSLVENPPGIIRRT